MLVYNRRRYNFSLVLVKIFNKNDNFTTDLKPLNGKIMRPVGYLITLCLFLSCCVSSLMSQQAVNLNDRPFDLRTPSGDIKGKLLTPGMGEGYPVVLLIAGSGPTDMDGNSSQMGLNPNSLKLLAQGLSEKGIASVRFDKRGVASSAASGKEEYLLRFDDYINDVRLWIDKLAGDRRFSGIYVLGYSEGALIGMLACKDNPKVKGYISMAGAGRPLYEVIESQLAAQPEVIKDMVKGINDSLKVGKLQPNVPLGLQALFRPSVQPYLISCYKYNPSEIIGTLTMPVLILQGKTDIQVTITDAGLLRKAAPKADYYLIDNMNHVLKTCTTTEQQAQAVTYTDPSLPVNAYMLLLIEKFVKKP